MFFWPHRPQNRISNKQKKNQTPSKPSLKQKNTLRVNLLKKLATLAFFLHFFSSHFCHFTTLAPEFRIKRRQAAPEKRPFLKFCHICIFGEFQRQRFASDVHGPHLPLGLGNASKSSRASTDVQRKKQLGHVKNQRKRQPHELFSVLGVFSEADLKKWIFNGKDDFSKSLSENRFEKT